jgi:hypothetical protein
MGDVNISKELVCESIVFLHQISIADFFTSLTVLKITFPFLVIAFLLHYFIDDLGCLHVKIVVSFILNMAFFHMTLFVIELQSNHANKFVCKLTAYFLYTSILSSIFWLFAMSVDVFLIA